MTSFTIRATRTTNKKKVPVERVLLWYDTVKKQMHTFHGGQLKFSYDFDQKRLLPKVEPLYEMKSTRQSSIWAIREWVDENADDLKLVVSENTSTHMTLILKEAKNDDKEEKKKNISLVEEALYSQRFDFSIGKHAQG